MKIGFLAMSGIRAHDDELLKLGLTLPGFVERSKTVASLPSLGLLYLAAATPDAERHELKYFEAEADRKEPAEVYTCDLVAISTFSAQVFEAYAIAGRLRAAGVKVAMGGLHVTVRPEEAAQHADYVIVGEGDNVWGAVVRAAQEDVNANSDPQAPLRYAVRRSAGRAASAAQPTDLPHSAGRSRTFDSKDFPPVDVSKLPIPRYDLLDHRPYNRFTVQTSRGCPWRCDFCASTVMLSRRYRKRPVEHVIRDIEAIQDLRPHPFIEFADDNTFVDKQWGKDLCRRLIPLNVKWFTETDITVADDDELLVLMRDAGCRQVLIGLESPPVQGAGALQGIEMHANAKAKWAPRYLERLRKIQNHGITVNGCFILGLDGHGPEIFEQVLDFALEVPLFDVQITVLTPFPGTPLYDRLLKEGRLIEPGRWDLCTLFDVNYVPTGLTPDELRQGMRWLTRRLYSTQGTERRRRPFFDRARRRALAV
jgi:radical SAM superfamily enzyme YgiQ (UPF0313 family)